MIEKKDLVTMRRIAPFFAHQGGRLGKIHDPPGPSFCVEGGIFDGEAYEGVVFTPTSPTSGASRTDSVLANKATGTIILVAGTEGFGAPDVGSYVDAARIADITVQGHPSGKVLIRQDDILDHRSLLHPVHRRAFEMVDQVIFSMGGKNSQADNESNFDVIDVGETVGPFICRKTRKGNQKSGDLAADWSSSWLADLQLADPKYATTDVEDFFLIVQLYGSAMQAGRSESHDKNLGVTWYRLSPDIDFKSGATPNPFGSAPAFRVEVTSGGNGRRYYRTGSGVRKVVESNNFPVHVQLWQKVR